MCQHRSVDCNSAKRPLGITNNFYRAILRRAERDIAAASRLSVQSICPSVYSSLRDVEVLWSHRLEFFEVNSMAD